MWERDGWKKGKGGGGKGEQKMQMDRETERMIYLAICVFPEDFLWIRSGRRAAGPSQKSLGSSHRRKSQPGALPTEPESFMFFYFQCLCAPPALSCPACHPQPKSQLWQVEDSNCASR